jgi:GntR family transcriptional repressor for pyruvate dehydrogenase complex
MISMVANEQDMMTGWRPLPQVVAHRLQKMILDGELKPGDRIPSQRALSERFSVSRASLREALLTLETLGLVRTEPARGTFVTESRGQGRNGSQRWRYQDSYSVRDVFETRLMLEGTIAATAALSVTQEDIAVLSRLTDEMETFWQEGDLLANVEADLQFHARIARACRNQMLRSMYDTVRDLLTETQRQPIPFTRSDRMRDSIGEHRAIIAALQGRQAATARSAMEDHIRNTAECAGVVV